MPTPLVTTRVTNDVVPASDHNDTAKRVNVLQEAPLNVQHPEYGASASNTAAQNDTAFASWLSVLNGASNAEGIIPTANYPLSAAWNLDGFTDVCIRGIGPRCTPPVAGGGGPQLLFNQTGSADFISMDAARSVSIEGLRIVANNTAYTGNMVNLTSATTDAQFVTFAYVGFYGNAAARNPASLVKLDRVNTIKFTECGFYDAQIGVLGHDVTFAIAVTFDMCTWQNNVLGHVKNGGENWKHNDCVFEPLSNGKPGAYYHAAGVTSVGLHYDGCWFGDVSNATGNPAWINFAGDNFTFTRNEMYAETAGSRHILIDENGVKGLFVVGNTFNGAGTPAVEYGATTGHAAHKIGPNFYNTGVSETGGTIPATLIQESESGMIFGGDASLYRQGADILETGSNFRIGADALLLGSAAGSGTQFIQGWEQSSDPAAPAANAGLIFFKDVGGKTSLAARFNSGAVHDIVTQDGPTIRLGSPNTQTGTAYTFVATDVGKVVEGNNAAAITFTVPTNATAAMDVGSEIVVRQIGAGQITLAAAGGVTIRARGSALKLAGQYAEATLTKRATDEWVFSGDTTT